MTTLRRRFGAALGIALAVGMLAAQPADARRGGSFGSRGARTYSAPRSTTTSSGYVPPVQRSMTPNTGPTNPGAGAYAPRPGQPGYAAGGLNNTRQGSRFGGFGGGLLGGLLAGGLIGGLMGHGWGGGWGGYGGGAGMGFLTIIIQLAILAFAISLIARLFRRRNPAFVSPFAAQPAFGGGPQSFGGSGFGSGPGPAAAPYVTTSGPAWEIPITPADQAAFEALLIQIQDAFGREDYGALRERCTPEIMSFLAEELSDNATHGRKNEVSGTRLLQADVGEAWNEGDTDYATAAMRYESIDLMRDRASGKVLSGDPDRASETVELWTFARTRGGGWKLSAIQET